MDVREKLVELLWEYDQMRMMRMSIEECADRLIPKGLTVRKCENDTKCSDLAICLDENAKEKTERIVDLMTSFYGVDPGYYGVEAYPLASHLIANGVTVQEWISVNDERKPKRMQECLCVCQFDDDAKGEWRFYNVLKWYDVPYQDNGIVNRPHFTDEGVHGMIVTHWMPLPKLPQPPKGE